MLVIYWIVATQYISLVNIQKRIHLGTKLLLYFANRQWVFSDHNKTALRACMSEQDHSEFRVQSEKIVDIRQYLENSILGMQKYVLKYKPEDYPKIRRMNNVYYFVDRFTKTVIIAIMVWFLWYFVNSVLLYRVDHL